METQNQSSAGPEATSGKPIESSEGAGDGKSKIELIEEALLKNVGGGTCYHQTCYHQTCYHQTCYFGHVCYHQTCYHQTCFN